MSANWVDQLNISQAIKEVCEDERKAKDFCLDPLRFQDLSIVYVAQNLEKFVRDRIVRKIKADSLIDIDVPKSNYVLRPGSRPVLLDWVAYTSIVNFIGVKIYKMIPDKSLSFKAYKEKFSKASHKRSIDYWIEFDNVGRELAEKFNFLLVTDISSFYENISLDNLRNRLLFLSKEKEYIEAVNYLIDHFLIPWTEKNNIQGFGLPQGITASKILADIYLYSLDREMKNRSMPFIRYVDDMHLYAKSRNELKTNIQFLVKALRDLRLNLNAKKTAVYETRNKKSLEKVFDPLKQTLNLIDVAFKSQKEAQIKLVGPLLLQLHEVSKNNDNPFSERYFRFFITHLIDLMRLKRLGESYLKKISFELTKDLQEKHHLSDRICFFLSAAARYNKELGKSIKHELIKFILDKENNIYEWQTMWILDTIRQIGDIDKTTLRKLKKYQPEHELCKAQLHLIISEHGSPDDREAICDNMRTKGLEHDQYRYLFLAVQELPDSVLKKIERKIPDYFRNYVLNMEKGKYYGFKYILEDKQLISDQEDYH